MGKKISLEDAPTQTVNNDVNLADLNETVIQCNPTMASSTASRQCSIRYSVVPLKNWRQSNEPDCGA